MRSGEACAAGGVPCGRMRCGGVPCGRCKGASYAARVAKEQAETGRDSSTAGDEPLRCAVCGHRITERAYAMEMAGAHEHVFVNPAGLAFRIGCFRAAPGCAYIGET